MDKVINVAMQSVRKIKAMCGCQQQKPDQQPFSGGTMQSFGRLSWRTRLDAVIVRRNSAAMRAGTNRCREKQESENEDRKDDANWADDDRDRVITFELHII
ncbi:MAG: hypothetical protein ACLVJ8_01445 [Ruthenibacterium lactatiformans]